ncbi:TetR/AcrR family transcriptional regulator [Streptomyces sp. NPDC092369]|uniref:TetR/AcrR family transcriptional regulator n=1 Tax=Streptomyces sp. NPDC092369 TaxID=3366015 RepID=UPI003822F817
MGQRSDAQLNRIRIVNVAREVLTEDDSASLNSIAKRAGVGPGTLYRHFPNREALVLEVFRTEVQKLVDWASELLLTEPPLQALRLWFERLAAHITIKQGLGDALTSTVHDAVTRESHGPVTGAIRTLLEAGQADGTIRPGLDPDDVLMLMSSVWRVPKDSAGKDQAQRLLDLAVESIRTHQ